MRSRFAKGIVAAILAVSALGVGIFAASRRGTAPEQMPGESIETETSGPTKSVIGLSVERRPIEAYTYGSGPTHLAFIGGMHGGYEWNSVLLAYQLLDYLDANPGFVPSGLSVTVIPSVNPDGVYKIIGKEGRFAIPDVPAGDSAPGRFNAHGVDLNRNFDCKWKPESMWRGTKVSGGSAAFSEPEAQAIRNFVLKQKPDAAIFWHSQANAVYASECEAGILPETLIIMSAYARAAGYPAVKLFDQYEISGDAEGWLASIGIPAITVELKTHETIEWEQNAAGIRALFNYYREKPRL